MATLSIQELAIRKTAVQHNVPESIVEKVIAHKNKALYEALYLYKTVEDSGFGKYSVRVNRIVKRISKINAMVKALGEKSIVEGLTEKEVIKLLNAIESLSREKEYLQSKI